MNSDNHRNGADLVLYNARVITLDPKTPYAELVAIKRNRILATGGKDDLDQFQGIGTTLVDCEGGTVIPGFNDAHCHPLAHAVGMLSVDCSPAVASDIAGIQKLIRRQAQETGEGEWIRAANYDESCLREKRPPDRKELDRIAPRHPVILVHYTAANCVLNSCAMRLAGITRDTPDPPTGKIHRDAGNGEPTGLITGRNEQVERVLPPIGEKELERGMQMANREYLSHGITSLQDTGWNNGERQWQTWQRLIGRGCVTPRVSMLMGTESLQESCESGLAMGAGDERLRLGGIKLALDESTGCRHPPQSDIENHAIKAVRHGFCVAFHVSDIEMLEASLTAINVVRREIPGAEHRFRLEHCTICPPDLLLEIKACKAIVVTQPAFLSHMGQAYLEETLPHQGNWFQPLGSFRRWGVEVALSSDSPLVPADPLTGICAAVNRKTSKGQVLGPREGISAMQALEMYTLGGAAASFEKNVKGSIEPGKFADLVVMNNDLSRVIPEQIPDLKVVYCIVDGKVVWE